VGAGGVGARGQEACRRQSWEGFGLAGCGGCSSCVTGKVCHSICLPRTSPQSLVLVTLTLVPGTSASLRVLQ
jgi:hypothetical protein